MQLSSEISRKSAVSEFRVGLLYNVPGDHEFLVVKIQLYFMHYQKCFIVEVAWKYI